MNESEQAEAIADIKSRHENHSSAWDDVCEDCKDLLEIVDSQAQKIAELEKDFNLAATIAQKHKDDLDAITKEYEDYKHKSGEAVVNLIDKNSEQAKEIERLKYKIKAADLRGANE